ncbi:MAG: tRNA (guanosine(37)-N1)-methyltransferase TrmD [bacterium]|nr:tRNA (guanosine(37)-N1)-methyltransferase TrmD [bacterium]
MTFTILTLFPEMFESPFGGSIIKRALDKETLTINLVNIRDFATDTHKTVDDKPFGGGAGMILKVDVCVAALESAGKGKRILLSPKGKKLTQQRIRDFAKEDHLILFCGHYEGVDTRVEEFMDEQISIGDYVLTGGELPAMVVVDAVSRLLPGVLGNPDSSNDESFSGDTVEYPQYTRPAGFRRLKVPDVLLSGNHAEIHAWRLSQRAKPPTS